MANFEQSGDRIREGSSAQGKVIIGLLAVLILAVSLLAIVSYAGRGDGGSESSSDSVSPQTETPAPSEEPAKPVDVDLAALDVDSIHEAPMPNVPEEWGNYTLDRKWEGRLDLDGATRAELKGEDGGAWVSSANGCGVETYIVIFRSEASGEKLRAELVDFNEVVLDEKVLPEGWMLFTNCATPRMAADQGSSQMKGTELAYEVHAFRQIQVPNSAESSALDTPEPSVETSVPQAEESVPQSDNGATGLSGYVECPGPGLTVYVPQPAPGGTIDAACSAAQQQSMRAESWCGGLYAPADVPRDEFIATCGREPQYAP